MCLASLLSIVGVDVPGLFSWFHGCSVAPSKLGFGMPLVHLLGIECFVGGVTGLADMTSSMH